MQKQAKRWCPHIVKCCLRTDTRTIQTEIRDLQTDIRGLQTENRRILDLLQHRADDQNRDR